MSEYCHDDAIRDLNRWRKATRLPDRDAYPPMLRLAAYIERLTTEVERLTAKNAALQDADTKQYEAHQSIIDGLRAERDEWEQTARVLAENTTAPFDWTADERLTWAREQVKPKVWLDPTCKECEARIYNGGECSNDWTCEQVKP